MRVKGRIDACDISFMIIDAVVSVDSFARDGVHLNANGDARTGKRIFQWMKANRRCNEGDH